MNAPSASAICEVLRIGGTLFCLISAILIQGLAFKSINCTKLYVFHKRKFPKVTSETQVSFVNEAPDVHPVVGGNQTWVLQRVSQVC
jgi:hypothetical protein